MTASRSKSRDGFIGALRRRFSYLWLVASLLLLLIISAVLEGRPGYDAKIVALWTLVLLTIVFAIGDRLSQVIVGGTIATAWLFLKLATIGAVAPMSDITENLLVIALNCYAIGLILRHIVAKDSEIDLNLLSGALAVYLLLGVTWAVSFLLIEEVSPGSFNLTAPEEDARWNQLLFFSFTTLTTLGYGDITPASPLARIWSVIEAMTGMLFVATMIARMVSLLRRRR